MPAQRPRICEQRPKQRSTGILNRVPPHQEPDSGHVILSFPVTSSEAAAIDAALDGMDQADWLRAVAVEAAGLNTARPAAGKRKPAGKTGRVTAPAQPGGCPHRLAVGAYCKTCGRLKT